MSRSNAEPRYTRVAIVLHWLIAAIVAFQFAFGWLMQEIPKQPIGQRAYAFNWHKSIGLTILLLMIVRLAWRLGHRPPPLPPLPAWQRRTAQTTHYLLYVALFTMPVAGYLGSVFSGYPVKLYGVTLPAWGHASPLLKELFSTIHYWTSFVLLSAVLLHVAGALKHALVEGDRLLSRMIWRTSQREPEYAERARASGG